MRKKLLAAFWATFLLISVTGCSGGNDSSDNRFNSDYSFSETSSGTSSKTVESAGSSGLKIKRGEVVGCEPNVKNANIPNGATSIADNAFANCEALVTVTLPDSITKLGSGAFGGCSALASVHIPDGVNEIPDSAFEGCSSLSDVHIPQSVTKIGKSAFKGCEKLAHIEIPSSVNSLSEDAFDGCKSLTASYMANSFAPRDLIDLCDIINGNYNRVDISYEQAKEIVGEDYLFIYETPRFDDINNAGMRWLLRLVYRRTDELEKLRKCEEYPVGSWIDDRYDTVLSYKLTDIEKYVQEYINPDFDINIWKKNAIARRTDDITDDGNSFDNEYFRELLFTHGSGFDDTFMDVEDCYTMGHKTYITVGVGNEFADRAISQAFHYGVNGHTSNDPRIQFVYRYDNGKYYLEAVKDISVEELAPWNQELVKMFDGLTEELVNWDEYGISPLGFAFADINNDGEDDFLMSFHTGDKGPASLMSHFYRISDKATGNVFDLQGKINNIYALSLYNDTVSGETVFCLMDYRRGGKEFYAIDNDYEASESLCSKYALEGVEYVTAWGYKIEDETVTEDEYKEYVSRFEEIEFTSFEDVTLTEFFDIYRAALS